MKYFRDKQSSKNLKIRLISQVENIYILFFPPFFHKTTLKMTKPLVLLSGTVHFAKEEWEALSDVAELIELTSKNRQEFLSDLSGKYSQIVAIYRTFPSVEITGRFDEELAAHVPSTLKYICGHGAGYDQIDVPFFTAKGIKISNTPGAVDAATADTHIYLILGALRNFSFGAKQLRGGQWLKDVAIANDPEGKVLGIIGMGGIGRAVRDRCLPFGFTKVLYYNRRRLSPELEKDSIFVDNIDELLAQTDVLALNCPLTKETFHLINKETLSKMKDGVVITNTARGQVIDGPALVEALESGKVGAVGLDVFEDEPNVHEGLLNHPRALLLPHMGTHTFESRRSMEDLVISNIRAGLTTGNVLTLIPDQVGILVNV